MLYLSSELLAKAFDKGTAEQKKRLFLTLASMHDALLKERECYPPAPVILIADQSMTKEETLRAERGAPVIRIHYVEPKHGQTMGTGALEGA
jgi:hypothetical protein